MYVPHPDQMFNSSSLIKVLTDSMGEKLLIQAGMVFYIYYPSSQQWEGKGDFLKIAGEEAKDFNCNSFGQFVERIHFQDKDKFLLAHNEAQAEVACYSISYRFKKKDGNFSHLTDNGCYYTDAEKGTYAMGLISDVTPLINVQKINEVKMCVQQLLSQIAACAHEVDSAEELILYTLKQISESTQWPLAHAIIFQEPNHNLRISPSIVYSSSPQQYLSLIELFHQYSSILSEYHQQVITEKRARRFDKITLLKNYPGQQQLSEAGFSHLILFPLILSNRVVGVIEFYGGEPNLPDEWITELMEYINKQLGPIIELKASTEQLRKFSMAIEQNFTSILITDANGTIEYVNPEFIQVTGYNANEVIGKKPSVLKSGIHPPEFYEQLWKTITAGNRWQGEICNRRKDGSLFWEQVAISPLQNVRHEIINYVAVKIDITAKRQYEEQLKKAKEEAEAANWAKSEFLANMSHEIRTPMNAILGFTEVLLQKIVDEQPKSYLDSIKSSGKTLLTLINDVLDLSKIEAGKMKLSHEFIDPFVLFKDVEYLFSLRAQEKGLEFKIITELNLPMGIEIDEVRLRQVLINLIGNAIKFTEKGSVIVHVSAFPISTERVNIKITVKDTGIGIDHQNLQKIFEPFTQLESTSTKRFGGTGLGLTITKRLVDLMGGEISVESELNKGTAFTVLLKNLQYTNRRQQNIEIINIDPYKIKFHPALVIIADDVDNNRKYLKTVIQDTNVGVLESTNGTETFELAKTRRPQLIITDLKMPGMNGFELLSKLRNDPLTRHIPVIATTASASIEEQDKLKVHRFDGLLIKPIQINDVYIELMRFLPHEIAEEDQNKSDTADIAIVAKTDSDIWVVKAILESEMMTLWKTFEEQQPLSEVESFASKIKELGKKYDLEILISYGNRLLMAVNNFDIDLILKIIADYPKLLSTFKVVTEE